MLLRSFLLLCLFTLLPLSAMKIVTKFKEEEPLSEELFKKAVETLHQKNPGYTIFNPSTDVRNLSFLAPHLKKKVPLIKKLKKYEKELSTLYLTTMQHRKTIGTAQLIAKHFLIDIKRLYILCLKEYPPNIEQKCAMLAHYFAKPSLNYTTLAQSTPAVFHKRIEGLLTSFSEKYPHLKIITIITYNKSEESGFFALLRFLDTKNHAVHHTIYELQTMTQFFWDTKCSSIKEYYNKHRLFFIKELQLAEE